MSNKLNTGASFLKDIKNAIATQVDNMLGEAGIVNYLPEREQINATRVDWTEISDTEKNALLQVKELARQLGGDPGSYENGVFLVTFQNKKAVLDYTDALEDLDVVYGFEIETYHESSIDGYTDQDEVDFDSINFDWNFSFDVYVYMDPSFVQYDAEEIEVDPDFEYDDETGFLQEVKRRIKVNFRGKRTIKMQCRPGFKWDPGSRTCMKITGSAVAKQRKALRKAVRTKRAKGQSFKVKVLRKTRKAKRFRKSMGLG